MASPMRGSPAGMPNMLVASAGMIAPKPQSLSHIEAASVPVVAVTAWQMLFEHARLSFGQTVLVHGSAGNVGAYVVQLARQGGARVIATATADDAAYVRKLGADQVIDFRSVRFEDVMDPVDAVIDTVGAEVQMKSLSVLRPGGILVSSVSQPEPNEAQRCDVRAVFFLVDVSTSYLKRIAEMIDAGKLEYTRRGGSATRPRPQSARNAGWTAASPTRENRAEGRRDKRKATRTHGFRRRYALAHRRHPGCLSE